MAARKLRVSLLPCALLLPPNPLTDRLLTSATQLIQSLLREDIASFFDGYNLPVEEIRWGASAVSSQCTPADATGVGVPLRQSRFHCCWWCVDAQEPAAAGHVVPLLLFRSRCNAGMSPHAGLLSGPEYTCNRSQVSRFWPAGTARSSPQSLRLFAVQAGIHVGSLPGGSILARVCVR